MSLVHQPEILFLDEPTAGLDPQARRLVWDFIRDLKTTGMTIILTTHDMVEADALSDHVAIIDHGKLIACGTVDELKRGSNNGNTIEISFFCREEFVEAKQQLERVDSVKKITDAENHKLTISFTGGAKAFKRDILTRLESFKTLHFREDSLEDIFLKLTGRGLREQ